MILRRTASVFFLLALALTVYMEAEAAPVQLTSSIIKNDQGVSIHILSPEVSLIQTEFGGELYQVLDTETEALFGAVGGPGVPAVTSLVEIPDGMAARLEFNVGSTTSTRNVDLAPIPLANSDNLASRTETIRPELYQRNVLIPAEVASLTAEFTVGGKKYVVLSVAPYQYNAATRTLYSNQNLTASVTFESTGTTSIDSRFDVPAWRELASALRDDPPVRDDVAPRLDNLGHLVIVIPDDNGIATAIGPLVRWKERKGYMVTVVRMVRDVENTQDALKGYLQDAQEEWDVPPSFVLLVGDATRMPTFRDGDAESVSWYISDNQYVTYGYNEGNEVEGWIPQSFIGRLPAVNQNETTQMVTKIIGYESTPFVQQNWVEGAVLIAAGVHSCIQTNQAIREQFESYGYERNSLHEAYTEYHAGQPNPDHNIINDGVNGGVGFVNFRGYDLWGGFTTGQIRSLRNGWKLPIVTGMVCATNDFANRFGNESIGEAWIRAYSNNTPTGAVASYGPTDRHTHTWFNNTMNGEFYKLLLKKNVHTLGALTVGSKLSLLRNYPSFLQLANGESVGYYFFTYNLLGDPTLQVLTATPQPLNVSYNNEVAIGTTNLTASVMDDDDNPVAGAYVHYFESNESRFGGYTDENGEIMLEVPPLDEGGFSVTVTATNYVPFLDTLVVTQYSRVASLNSFITDDDREGDSRGNSDGFINPGELIEFDAVIANSGSDELQNVTATLESENPFVQITRSSADFGTISAGEQGQADRPYLVDISTRTPSGTRIDFLLNVNSGENTYPIHLSRTVEGYDFHFARYETLEGDLTPGTTREMVVTIENTGNLATGQLTGSLYSSNRFIQIRVADAIFGSVEVGESIDNSDHPFELTAGASAYHGGTINFGLLLQDAAGLKDSLTFRMTLGEPAVDSPQGPDGYGYWAIDSRDTSTGVAPEYERLQGNNNLNITDNNDAPQLVGLGGAVRTIDLPFEFTYYGETYETATVSTNGFLVFGESISIGWNNQELGSGLTPYAMIAPWWIDLFGGSVFTRYDEDNSRFIIEWRGYSAQGAQNLNFALVLYDPLVAPTRTGDGEIVFEYITIPQQRDYPDEPVTIGLSAPDGETNLTIRHARTSDLRTGLLHSGMAVKFTTGVSTEVGTLQGRVTDTATGMAMQGVRVMLEGTGFFALTDAVGEYRMEGAVIGNYTVIAHKAYFNDDRAMNVEIRQNEVTTVDFSLTHPTFGIDIERINIVVPPDSTGSRSFTISNDGNGPLDYQLKMTYIPDEEHPDLPWSRMFDWDVSTVPEESAVRGIATDGEFFYFAGQGVRDSIPHPIYVFDKHGEFIRRFNQAAYDSASRGFACMDFNGENLVAVEQETIVEQTLDGELVRAIHIPDRSGGYSIAYSPERGTYFSKTITGNTIFELDSEGNTVNEFPVPENSFRVYGMAWYSEDPEGYNLYMTRFNQGVLAYELYGMNTETGEFKSLRQLEVPENGNPLDMVITKRFDPLYWTIAILNNVPGADRTIGFQLSPNSTWISYEPGSGSLQPGGSQQFDVEFYAEDMPEGLYEVILALSHNAEGEVFEIPVSFTIGNEVRPFDGEIQLPTSLTLQALYPNPFNSRANVGFSLPTRSSARLILFDATGREMLRMDLGRLEAGYHTASFDGQNLSSGIYLVKLQTSEGFATRKIVLMK